MPRAICDLISVTVSLQAKVRVCTQNELLMLCCVVLCVPGWSLPEARYKPVFPTAIPLVLAFFVLELRDIMHKGNIIFFVGARIFLLE